MDRRGPKNDPSGPSGHLPMLRMGREGYTGSQVKYSGERFMSVK
jgi:hypothetical protein